MFCAAVLPAQAISLHEAVIRTTLGWHTWSTGQPPPRSMFVHGGDGGGCMAPPTSRPVTITVPFMGTLAAQQKGHRSVYLWKICSALVCGLQEAECHNYEEHKLGRPASGDYRPEQDLSDISADWPRRMYARTESSDKSNVVLQIR